LIYSIVVDLALNVHLYAVTYLHVNEIAKHLALDVVVPIEDGIASLAGVG
jgi:hypothetical protein